MKRVNLIFVSDKSYRKTVMGIIKKYPRARFCYVGLDKTCFYFREYLKARGVDIGRFYFVDAISSVIRVPNSSVFCEFASAPYDLAGIGRGIENALSKGYNFIIFDSLSDLLAYGVVVPAGLKIVNRFIASFRKKLGEGRAFFLCNYRDREKFLIEESISAFDSVVERT